MASEHIPSVSPFLVAYLRRNREWQDKLPPADWSRDQVQRAIGANEVIAFLERLANGEVE